jgi:hypothetical protein
MTFSGESDVELIGFALSDCVVEVGPSWTKYLRAVHRTALEIAIPNQFGAEVGGFWLMAEQINQLRKLPDYYSPEEAEKVKQIVEAYLSAQLESSPNAVRFGSRLR